jgi:hypothetical protein
MITSVDMEGWDRQYELLGPGSPEGGAGTHYVTCVQESWYSSSSGKLPCFGMQYVSYVSGQNIGTIFKDQTLKEDFSGLDFGKNIFPKLYKQLPFSKALHPNRSKTSIR